MEKWCKYSYLVDILQILKHKLLRASARRTIRVHMQLTMARRRKTFRCSDVGARHILYAKQAINFNGAVLLRSQEVEARAIATPFMGQYLQ